MGQSLIGIERRTLQPKPTSMCRACDMDAGCGVERIIKLNGTAERRKTNVRLYAYDGQILLTAARLYQGQTTNFRTPGGGFAPVCVI